jgi:hypothetical protein
MSRALNSRIVEPDSASLKREAPLAMDPEQFRAVAHELVDRIADFLGSLPQRPVTPGEEVM